MTGVRAFGGLVLVAGAVACVRLAVPRVGWPRTAWMLIAALAVFALSHPLGELIGTWPAVLVSASLAAASSAVQTTPAR